jgi:hypothetical protein
MSKPPELPQEGGAWVRQKDGKLVREVTTPSEKQPVEAPVQRPVKEV